MATLERETEIATMALHKLMEYDADLAQRFFQDEIGMDEEETKLHGVDRLRKATEIDWDLDEEDTETDLPSEVDIPWNVFDDDIVDYLSDEYGFCVREFNVEEDNCF